MIRYAALNIVWLTAVWLVVRRMRFEYHPSTFLITLIGLYLMMVVFNTYLTALPIVEYNPAYILGFKILTWPIEDLAYLVAVIFLAPGLYMAFLHYYETTSHTDSSSPTPTPRSRKKPSRHPRRRS